MGMRALGLMAGLVVMGTMGVACGDGEDGLTPPTTTVSGSGGGATSSGSSGTGGGATTTATSGSGGGGGMVEPGPTKSIGCDSGMGLAEGEHSFMLAGRNRRYILRLPENYSQSEPWPIVLALHGNGGSVGYWDTTSGPRNIRDVLKNDAILVVVEAIEGNWRDYNAPQSSWPDRIEEELSYFEEVLTQVETDLCVNEDAIFSMGFSGGGSFSGVLGCRRSDIRAIAVGGSVIYFDPQYCIHAPAAWIAISDGDESNGRFAYRDHFRDAAMCQETSMQVTPSECVAYDGCAADTPVHYCDHPGGHQWPDFGAQASWDFFSQFVEK